MHLDRIGSLLGLLLASAWTIGCGDSGTGETTGDECTGVLVENIGGSSPGSECHPTPSECEGQSLCGDDQPCEAALYGLCESPYIGVGCSPAADYALISCNE